MCGHSGPLIFFTFSPSLTEGSTRYTEAEAAGQQTKQSSGPESSNEKPSGTSEEAQTQQTQEMIKLTRKNLRPVLQPFKRAEKSQEEEEAESPVDILLRQGDLRGRQGRRTVCAFWTD